MEMDDIRIGTIYVLVPSHSKDFNICLLVDLEWGWPSGRPVCYGRFTRHPRVAFPPSDIVREATDVEMQEFLQKIAVESMLE